MDAICDGGVAPIREELEGFNSELLLVCVFAREARELVAEEKRDRELREEKERAEAKWKEEQAKKERDEFRDEMQAQQKAFFGKLAKSTPTGKRCARARCGERVQPLTAAVKTTR